MSLEALNGVPLVGPMLVIAFGFFLGRGSLGGVSLGPAGATLFLALGLGHLGLQAGDLGLGSLGFALFIYSVGFDAAPHFFASFRERRGFGFVAVAVAVNLLAVAATLGAARLLGLDPSTSAGVLAGALTSAPTFAAASEVAPDPARLSVAFALTFPFGLLGVVLALQLVPRMLGEDLARSAARDEQRRARARGARRASVTAAQQARAFVVSHEEVTGRPLRELDLTHRTGCVISRIRAGDSVVIPDGDTVLELDDRVMAAGRVDELRVFERCVGPETSMSELETGELHTRRIEVRLAEATARSLDDLRIIQRHHCVVTRIERGLLAIEPDPEATLVRGDVITAIGRRDDLRELARSVGRFEPPPGETDVAVYAGGIVLGLLLGSVRVSAGGLELGLGTAGGLLAMGLLLGSQRRLGPLRTHVPREARQLVRDLGILLFAAETGLQAGAQVAAVLQRAAWETFAAGVAVNAIAALGALALARLGLRMRPVDAWGSICGGLTSSSALQAVRRAADSNEPAIAYAAAYAVASVLATLAGPLVVLWMS